MRPRARKGRDAPLEITWHTQIRTLAQQPCTPGDPAGRNPTRRDPAEGGALCSHRSAGRAPPWGPRGGSSPPGDPGTSSPLFPHRDETQRFMQETCTRASEQLRFPPPHAGEQPGALQQAGRHAQPGSEVKRKVLPRHAARVGVQCVFCGKDARFKGCETPPLWHSGRGKARERDRPEVAGRGWGKGQQRGVAVLDTQLCACVDVTQQVVLCAEETLFKCPKHRLQKRKKTMRSTLQTTMKWTNC